MSKRKQRTAAAQRQTGNVTPSAFIELDGEPVYMTEEDHRSLAKVCAQIARRIALAASTTPDYPAINALPLTMTELEGAVTRNANERQSAKLEGELRRLNRMYQMGNVDDAYYDRESDRTRVELAALA